MHARTSVRRWGRGARFSAALVLSLAGIVTGVTASGAGASQAHAASAPTALIYGPSVIGADGNVGTQGGLEQTILQSEGYGVNIVSAAQWDAMTTAQFAAYQLLVIGDPQCGSTGMGAVSNEPTWMGAVNGNIIVIGTDPAFHYANGSNSLGAYATAQAGLTYAGSDAGATNLYLDLSCAYADSYLYSAPILAGIESGFTVTSGYTNTDPNTTDVTAAGAAALGLTGAQLSGWYDSVHEYFSTWPADFTPLAVVQSVPGGVLSGNAPAAHAMSAHLSISSGSTATCVNPVTSVTGIVGCPYIVGRSVAPGGIRDLTATRTRTSLTVRWQAGGESAPFLCTLLYGYGNPSTFTVHTTATQCSFYFLDPTTVYGVSVAGGNGAGPASTVFANPVPVTITCRRGPHVRHLTGLNPRCPGGWRLVHTS